MDLHNKDVVCNILKKAVPIYDFDYEKHSVSPATNRGSTTEGQTLLIVVFDHYEQRRQIVRLDRQPHGDYHMISDEPYAGE